MHHLFIAGLVAVAVLALLGPQALKPPDVPTYPFIIGLLFLTSLTFELGEFLHALRSWSALALSLAGTYLLLPILLWMAALPWTADDPFHLGLLVLAAAPTTLASAAIWTRLAGGNTALSVAMIVLSNLAGIVLGPLMILALLGQSAPWPVLKLIQDLALNVLLPLAVGQLIGAWFGEALRPWRGIVKGLSQILILLVVYLALCRLSSGSQPSLLNTLLLALVCAGAHLACAGLLWLIALACRLPTPDGIALSITGSQKTLPVSLFLLNLLLPGNGLAVLPAVMFHALQLTLDSILIPIYQHALPPDPDGAPE
jgi:sodium/bile acid cotransporter 7